MGKIRVRIIFCGIYFDLMVGHIQYNLYFCTNKQFSRKNVHMKNICIVVGARPNFIKVAPIIWAIDKAKSAGEKISYMLVYTGSCDDATLEPSLFDDLQINKPDVYLGVNCSSLNELTGMVMAEFERYLSSHQTDVVIVVDDLASTMAVAIVTKKCGICLAHLVAGTRSFDIKMPKEINRLVIDGLSDYLFTAGAGSNSIVTREGASLSQIYMVGNVLIDTLRFNHSRLRRPQFFDKLMLNDKGYLVLTLNRKCLFSNEEKLKCLILSIIEASGMCPVIAPLREKAASVVASLEIDNSKFVVLPSMPYLEFGYLSANARGVITDSGNVAEEATFNNVPCITLNSYTEHIETVTQGTNVLVGENPDLLKDVVADMVAGRWKKGTLPDRWDGRTAERIVRILIEKN